MTTPERTALFRNRRGLPFLAALLPAVLACGFQWAGARPSGCAAAPVRSPLAFHQYLLNLGPVEPLAVHFGTFRFTNTSSETIELRDLRTSCGCLTQQLVKKEFAPGEEGEFSLLIRTANQTPGPKQYLCTAVTGPVGRPDVQFETELSFRIELPERSVTLQPRALAFFQPGQEVIENIVQVRDLRDRRLNVVRVTADSPFVEAEVVPAARPPASDGFDDGVVAQIQVRIGEVPSGRHSASVRIETDDPAFPVLKLPIQVTGALTNAAAEPEFSNATAEDKSP